jgi:hypothetical protein
MTLSTPHSIVGMEPHGSLTMPRAILYATVTLGLYRERSAGHACLHGRTCNRGHRPRSTFRCLPSCRSDLHRCEPAHRDSTYAVDCVGSVVRRRCVGCDEPYPVATLCGRTWPHPFCGMDKRHHRSCSVRRLTLRFLRTAGEGGLMRAFQSSRLSKSLMFD